MPNQPTQGVLILPDYAPTDFAFEVSAAMKARGFEVTLISIPVGHPDDGVTRPALHCIQTVPKSC